MVALRNVIRRIVHVLLRLALTVICCFAAEAILVVTAFSGIPVLSYVAVILQLPALRVFFIPGFRDSLEKHQEYMLLLFLFQGTLFSVLAITAVLLTNAAAAKAAHLSRLNRSAFGLLVDCQNANDSSWLNSLVAQYSRSCERRRQSLRGTLGF